MKYENQFFKTKRTLNGSEKWAMNVISNRPNVKTKKHIVVIAVFIGTKKY
jgi:hypothetical protein